MKVHRDGSIHYGDIDEYVKRFNPHVGIDYHDMDIITMVVSVLIPIWSSRNDVSSFQIWYTTTCVSAVILLKLMLKFKRRIPHMVLKIAYVMMHGLINVHLLSSLKAEPLLHEMYDKLQGVAQSYRQHNSTQSRTWLVANSSHSSIQALHHATALAKTVNQMYARNAQSTNIRWNSLPMWLDAHDMKNSIPLCAPTEWL